MIALWSFAMIGLTLSAGATERGKVATQTPPPHSAPVHFGGELLHQAPGIFGVQRNPGATADTLRMIEEQERNMNSGTRSTASVLRTLTGGQDRAREMVRVIQTEEMRQALEKVTVRGKDFLEKNSALRSPLALISGALSVWVGGDVRLVDDEKFKLSTRIEGRNRSGEFRMESPLFNGRFQFNEMQGVTVNMNREIPGLKSRAEIDFQARTQSLTTQIRQPLAPHLDLTFGATQLPQMNNKTDGQAKIEYQFQF
jgi:hypothetical protein